MTIIQEPLDDTLINTHNGDTLDETIERPVATGSFEERRPRRRWAGWVFIGAALVAVAGLTTLLVAGDDDVDRPRPVGDAKDHPRFGRVTPIVGQPVGDAKDHQQYGQVTPVGAEFTGDVKDHPGYGPVGGSTPGPSAEVQRLGEMAREYGVAVPTSDSESDFTGDVKDHPGYGPAGEYVAVP